MPDPVFTTELESQHLVYISELEDILGEINAIGKREKQFETEKRIIS